jgi:NADPH:quinone reductase-like Zn-dependent oxidoreductase
MLELINGMKAVVLHMHGGVDKLRYQDFPEPVCNDDEALVRVKACSVNRLDIWVRKGLPNRRVNFPHILGCDFSGYLVNSIGEFKANEDVLVYPGIGCNKCKYCLNGKENMCKEFSIIGGFSDWNGGYAQYTKVPYRNLIRMPKWLSYEEASTLGVAYLTAYSMIKKATEISSMNCVEGNTVLVYSAGSGVGIASIQFAKALGFNVITTVGDKSKLSKARIYTDHVIDRSEKDIVSEVMSITGNEGVSIVIDQIGIWDTSIRCVKKGGVVMVCGATADEYTNVEVRILYNKLASIIGAYLGTKADMLEMLNFMHKHNIKPVIDTVFALEDAMLAHAMMEMNHNFGKIVLRVD